MKVKYRFKIETELLDDLRLIAERQGITLAEYINNVLLDDAERMKKVLFADNDND